jgi:hypothetical protein
MHAAREANLAPPAGQPLPESDRPPHVATLLDTGLHGLGFGADDMIRQLQAGKTFVEIAHALGTTAEDLTIALRAAIVQPHSPSLNKTRYDR